MSAVKQGDSTHCCVDHSYTQCSKSPATETMSFEQLAQFLSWHLLERKRDIKNIIVHGQQKDHSSNWIRQDTRLCLSLYRIFLIHSAIENPIVLGWFVPDAKTKRSWTPLSYILTKLPANAWGISLFLSGGVIPISWNMLPSKRLWHLLRVLRSSNSPVPHNVEET